LNVTETAIYSKALGELIGHDRLPIAHADDLRGPNAPDLPHMLIGDLPTADYANAYQDSSFCALTNSK
jgi:hypothetical protein